MHFERFAIGGIFRHCEAGPFAAAEEPYIGVLFSDGEEPFTAEFREEGNACSAHGGRTDFLFGPGLPVKTIDNGIKTEEPFVGNGLWDVSVVDPDGYNVHFESKTDVEEETRYSEWRKGK